MNYLSKYLLFIVLRFNVHSMLYAQHHATPKVATPSLSSVPAFPGAHGYGALTPGWRGGRVIAVTSLEAEGPGTLRAALSVKGLRIIIFRVGGTIELKDEIIITEPFVTVAGQTAPGDGICIRGAGIIVSTHDVVIRHLRVRVGDHPEGPEMEDRDALFVSGTPGEVYIVVIDHCSVSWAVDETMGTWSGGSDVTFQWWLVSESLFDSFHPEGPHGMGVLFGSSGNQRFTMHHCLIAHHHRRHPRINYSGDRGIGKLDFRNNVIYNFGNTFGIFLGKTHANYIGNTVIKGINSESRDHLNGNAEKMYFADNVLTWRSRGLEPTEGMGVIDEPLDAPPVTTHTAGHAYDLVLRYAGATLPVRDVVDDRVVRETWEREGRLIDSQRDVGGWPGYAGGEAPVDGDGDGMPDSWEREHGFNPEDDFLNTSFVPVEGQTFMMERDDEFDWGPVEVTLSPYQVARYEVTQEQWTAVMGTRSWEGRIYATNHPNHPASYISWEDCQVFLEQLNAGQGTWYYSLPTEAQWECAARAGTGLLFGIAGDDGDIATDAGRKKLALQTWSQDNTIEEGEKHPQAVGQLEPNPWGIHDLAGNVNEWCQDVGARWYWHDIEKITDPTSLESGEYRVTRGKSFYRPLDEMLWYSSTAHRPHYRTFETGFRMVRTRRPEKSGPYPLSIT